MSPPSITLYGLNPPLYEKTICFWMIITHFQAFLKDTSSILKILDFFPYFYWTLPSAKIIIFRHIILYTLEFSSIEIDSRKLFLYSNLIYNIFHCFLFPLYILKTIPNHIPDFFSNQSMSKKSLTFYVIPPTITPRRYNIGIQNQDTNRRNNLEIMQQQSFKNECILKARYLKRNRACELPAIME